MSQNNDLWDNDEKKETSIRKRLPTVVNLSWNQVLFYKQHIKCW